MGIAEEAGKTATSVVAGLQSTPLALVLVLLNLAFLGFVLYILGQISANASVREKSQVEMISKLITDIRDCRQGPARGGT
jgi:hypothetical protein